MIKAIKKIFKGQFGSKVVNNDTYRLLRMNRKLSIKRKK